MNYQHRLDLVCSALSKCRLSTQIVSVNSVAYWQYSGFISAQLNTQPFLFLKGRKLLQGGEVLIVSDAYLCRYVILTLPSTKGEALIIGPYLSKAAKKEQILELSESLQLDANLTKALEQSLNELPVITADSAVFALIEAFCEDVFSKDYTVTELSLEDDAPPLTSITSKSENQNIINEMQLIEQRYAYENQLMEAVIKGSDYKSDKLFAALSQINLEHRIADPVRSLKNYCIILNTLLRKAAEKGGVHPIHINSISSDFAKRIEQLNGAEQIKDFMKNMFKGYCKLVKTHSLKDYSPPVQRVLACISSNLNSNLRLNALAKLQNISPAYLSTLFKKELGVTLTSYVNSARVEHAIQLLKNTHLQVQTIAAHCGMPDVQYFSKIFKKQTGVTPKEFREKNRLKKSVDFTTLK